MNEEELTTFKELLELLWQAHRGRIKSVSKELLKVVFETGSEKLGRLKLLQNPTIKSCFSRLSEEVTDRTKAILR